MISDNDIQLGKLYGVGLGPGDPDLITIKAVKALKIADIIYVPKSKEQASTALNIVKDYLPPHAVVEHLEFPMDQDIEVRINARKRNADLIAQQLNEGKVLVFLTLGDPMLYSTYSYVLEYLNSEHIVETIPGIYSFAAISSLLSMPLCKGDEKLAVLSSIDADTSRIIKTIETVVFMKVSGYYKELHSLLKEHKGSQFVMITDAGKETQKIYHSIDVLNEKVPYFSTIILQKSTEFNILN